MRKERNEALLFQKCSSEGSFIVLAKTDSDQIKSMLNIALVDLETVKTWQNQAPKKSGQWNAILKLAYDVLHTLAEAFLQFDKIKAKTHECLFAYLCEKHAELELDWNFFDKLRTLRNRSLYYGKPASYDDWKEIEFQLNLYINTLNKAIESRLKNYKE